MEYWNNRWSEGKIGWHINEINPILIRYSSRMDLATPKRIFVPLCGKSIDILWLYKCGHEVVGVEGVEAPVKEFFEEHKIPYIVKELPWAKVYQTGDDRLKLYVCNIYDLRTDEVGKFDAFWDRGSLVAISAQDRGRYVQLMRKMFAPSFVYLLATLQYDGLDINGGPPRCVSHQLTEQLFGDFCNIELLEKCDVSNDTSRTKWGLKVLWESVHLLTPKHAHHQLS